VLEENAYSNFAGILTKLHPEEQLYHQVSENSLETVNIDKKVTHE
jgi:hypothetical protein